LASRGGRVGGTLSWGRFVAVWTVSCHQSACNLIFQLRSVDLFRRLLRPFGLELDAFVGGLRSRVVVLYELLARFVSAGCRRCVW
jgi:hypothetical protein